MKHGLMGKEKLENLGYTPTNSWDNEEHVRILTNNTSIEEERSILKTGAAG